MKKKLRRILNKQLTNNRMLSINGMPLTNANGAIDVNSTGYQYIVDTTSEIRDAVIEQKFYEVPIADFMPVDVGLAAWKSEIVQNLTYDIAGSFYEGDVDTMVGNGRIAEVNTAIAPIRMPTMLWAKGASWNISEIQQAAASSNWDPVEGKLKTLKKNWDLGIQETAFLGHPSVSAITGLINNAEVNINTTLISVPLSEMTTAQFTTFLENVLQAYYTNSGSTMFPDTFIMPTSDYLGMGVPYSADFPNITKLDYLVTLFKKMTGNESFAVKPLAYCQSEFNTERGINKNRYVLYKNNSETLSMTIPVDFNLYDASSTNSIFWSQPGIAQYSGVMINRAPEVLYIDET